MNVLEVRAYRDIGVRPSRAFGAFKKSKILTEHKPD